MELPLVDPPPFLRLWEESIGHGSFGLVRLIHFFSEPKEWASFLPPGQRELLCIARKSIHVRYPRMRSLYARQTYSLKTWSKADTFPSYVSDLLSSPDLHWQESAYEEIRSILDLLFPSVLGFIVLKYLRVGINADTFNLFTADQNSIANPLFNFLLSICRVPSHPNIMPYYGCHFNLSQGGYFYIYMPRCQPAWPKLQGFGSDVVHAGRLQSALPMIIQVARGLCHIHQHEVVHAGLHPANILISPDGNFLLSDFGMREDVMNLGESGEEITAKEDERRGARWIHPARMAERIPPTAPHDVFSFGQMLYELLVWHTTLPAFSYGIYCMRMFARWLSETETHVVDLTEEEEEQALELDPSYAPTIISLFRECTHLKKSPPSMDEVVTRLEQLMI